MGLPELNAFLNGIATCLLISGGVAIKSGREILHRKLMVSAFMVSALFLISYVTHRYLMKAVHTPFGGEGIWKTIYYVMLISHVILAIFILPLIFRTIYLAIKDRRELHKKWARVTYPIWLYVSVTGVLVYFFLYQWF